MTRPRQISLPASGFNEIVMSRNGPLLYNRHDQYVGASLRKYGEFSPGEAELFQRMVAPGGVIVEGGANIGAHTVGLSQMVGPQGKVLAFEPQRIVYQTLCANLALNSCSNVHAYPCGLGAASGEITVPFLAPDRPANFGGLSLVASGAGEQARLMTIDELGLAACHVIKLDVEGMEVEALQGATKTVAGHRPAMYVENDREQRSAELIGLLLSWDYRLYWHTPPLFSPNNFAGDPENIFGDICSFNILCFAREKGITVNGAKEITSEAVRPG